MSSILFVKIPDVNQRLKARKIQSFRLMPGISLSPV